MIKEITTKSGFKISMNPDVADNMELLDALAQANDDGISIVKVANMLLGTDDKRRLYDHLRTDDGRVPMEPFMAEIEEILNSLGAKN